MYILTQVLSKFYIMYTVSETMVSIQTLSEHLKGDTKISIYYQRYYLLSGFVYVHEVYTGTE